MLKVDKNDEPEFFTEFKKKSNPKSWKDFDFEIKGKLKEYIFVLIVKDRFLLRKVKLSI